MPWRRLWHADVSVSAVVSDVAWRGDALGQIMGTWLRRHHLGSHASLGPSGCKSTAAGLLHNQHKYQHHHNEALLLSEKTATIHPNKLKTEVLNPGNSRNQSPVLRSSAEFCAILTGAQQFCTVRTSTNTTFKLGAVKGPVAKLPIFRIGFEIRF